MKLPQNTPPPSTEAPGKTGKTGNAPVQANVAGDARVTAPSARAQLDALQLANRQVALARVEAVTTQQQSRLEQLILDIRGKPLTVQTAIGDTRLEPGDWVKVMRAGNELQLMGRLAQSPGESVARALAQHMPWQHSLDSGIARLVATLESGLAGRTPTSPPGERAQPLPAPVRQAVEQLIARLPASNTFTPGAGKDQTAVAQVRQWIADSGLFSESQMLRRPEAPATDLKAALVRVVASLLTQQGQGLPEFNRLTPMTSPELVQAPLQFPGNLSSVPAPANRSEPPTAGQVLRLLAGMLNRITVNQLHSQVLAARPGAEGPAAAPTTSLLLELPLLLPDQQARVAQVRIEQSPPDEREEKRKAHSGASEWRLSLAINLEETGPLHFDIALRQQQVSALVWAEQQKTARQVQQELPLLRKSLDELGLEVMELECRRGTPQGATTKLEYRLVDTRA